MSQTSKGQVHILLVGDSGVGKTALAHRMVENQFISDTRTTVGVTFLAKTVDVDGRAVSVQVWDTAGQVSPTCAVYSIVVCLVESLRDCLIVLILFANVCV